MKSRSYIRVAGLSLIGTLMLAISSGCSRFSGEWVQDGTIARDGSFKPVETDNRLALKFTPPSTVRVGRYLVPAGVVERDSTTLTRMSPCSIARRAVRRNGAAHRGRPARHVRQRRESAAVLEDEGRRSIFPPAVVIPSIVDAKIREHARRRGRHQRHLAAIHPRASRGYCTARIHRTTRGLVAAAAAEVVACPVVQSSALEQRHVLAIQTFRDNLRLCREIDDRVDDRCILPLV